MLDIEDRICQKLAKEFGLPVEEIRAIQRSQFKQVKKTIQEFDGKCFAIPYLGEFQFKDSEGIQRYLEVCRNIKNNKVE